MRYQQLIEVTARTGHGWKPVTELVQAAYSALDDMGDEEHERFERLSPWRKVAYRYLSADCDEFAVVLHGITGWSMVSNLAHRLVQAPQGLLDASGWVTVQKLQRRYGKWWTSDLGSGQADSMMLGDLDNDGFDQRMGEVVSAIRQFPWAPYNTRMFQAMSFRPITGVDEPTPEG